MEHIARRSRRVYWLNPEPQIEWGTHDSEMAAYTEFCNAVFEVRNLRQPARSVEEIL